MSEEKKIRRTHRLCPCNPMDIEGIQTWLEDMAADGLLLENESVFFGFWSFERRTPQKAIYRLEVVQGKFLEDTDTPQLDMLETAEAMGWEYVTKYHSFYIFRSFDPQVCPLNTDPAVQALTVSKLRRQQHSLLLWDIFYIILIFVLRRSNVGYLFRGAAMLGIVYTLSFIGFFASAFLDPLVNVLTLGKYVKRLKKGDSLDKKASWKPGASIRIAGKILPVLLAFCFLITLFGGWIRSTDRISIEAYTGNAPFVTIQELYPEGDITARTDMGDYNTYITWSNPLSRNTEWNESGHIRVNGDNYHFILRITCHETIAPWFARLLALDYYAEDSNRYSGKRFEDLESPDANVDLLRVYSSYGIRYVLLQHGSTVIHGTISIDEGQTADHWEQWLNAAVEKIVVQ